jgi:metal-responsive CopG/Arc/MetJ family transcriptional regulator
MFTKNSIRATAGYGNTRTVAISIPVSIVEEIERRRRFDSRSRYILRAVDKYLREEEEK